MSQVAWHAWGAAAFARARDENKPVLLDIGAAWCHWCHVMDRESYHDPALADLLNAEWVCIRVDRDERPDVDARYQRAVQAVSGQGGWPLTAFLTPDAEVFFGGTYFPPDGTHGRPGFRTILTELARIWRAERPRLVEQAGLLRRRLAEASGEAHAAGPVTLPALAAATDVLTRTFDYRHGGFGDQPKFPHPTALRFLLPRQRALVDQTLTAMANGGIRDHVGGGFHRYSVDARWIVPHFEKMLYDNAELLAIYLDAGVDTPRYRAVAEGIVDWTLEVMADPAGGYAASQDADVGLDDDGDYFTWTREEIRAAAPDVADALIARFGVPATGRGVLHLVDPTVAADATRLAAARMERTAPFVDRTLYVGWSALMASALLQAGAALDAPRTTHHALLTLTRIFTEGLDPAGGMVHALGRPLGGLLDDQAYAARAALDAFEHTGDPVWRERSATLLDHVLAAYANAAGLLRDRAGPADVGPLTDDVIPLHDAPAPSPNGVAADTLLRLAEHTGEARWRDAAAALLAGVGGALADFGVHGGALLCAADRLLHPATHVVVVAGDDEPGRALVRAARAAWVPRRVLVLLRPDADTGGLPAPVQAMLTGSAPRAYVCVGAACRAPVDTPAALSEALRA